MQFKLEQAQSNGESKANGLCGRSIIMAFLYLTIFSGQDVSSYSFRSNQKIPSATV